MLHPVEDLAARHAESKGRLIVSMRAAISRYNDSAELLRAMKEEQSEEQKMHFMRQRIIDDVNRSLQEETARRDHLLRQVAEEKAPEVQALEDIVQHQTTLIETLEATLDVKREAVRQKKRKLSRLQGRHSPRETPGSPSLQSAASMRFPQP